MEISVLENLAQDFEKLKSAIIAERSLPAFEDYRKQYYPHLHSITDTGKRPDKLIQVPILDEDGNDTGRTSVRPVPVARLSMSYQKMIVQWAAAILCGNPIELTANPTDTTQQNLLDVLNKTWEDNKLDYESKKLAKLMMSETEVAELWYTEPITDPAYWEGTANANAKFRLRMKILANSLGDTLYPVFNASGDMIAFGRSYKVKMQNSLIEHFDLYTDKTIYRNKKEGTEWQSTPEVNVIGKIPVIYYAQEYPEWWDVQPLIERMEVLKSNHADSNDYFGMPIMVATGQVTGFATKGEQGKVLEMSEGGDLKMLTWDQAPASIDLEYKRLDNDIYTQTFTPKITEEEAKGLGVYSGIAMKYKFTPSHLKASDKEENFGKSIQRRINYLKFALAVINQTLRPALKLSIRPKFEYFLPQNDLELMNMLSLATGGEAFMSVETATAQNPLIEDGQNEFEKLNGQNNSPKALDDLNNG